MSALSLSINMKANIVISTDNSGIATGLMRLHSEQDSIYIFTG